jgi:hypothetical protein
VLPDARTASTSVDAAMLSGHKTSQMAPQEARSAPLSDDGADIVIVTRVSGVTKANYGFRTVAIQTVGRPQARGLNCEEGLHQIAHGAHGGVLAA